MEITQDYQNFLLELMLESDLKKLKLKAIWWIIAGNMLLAVAIVWMVAVLGDGYSSGFFFLVYSMPSMIIGIVVLLIGIMTFMSYSDLRKKSERLQMWRYTPVQRASVEGGIPVQPVPSQHHQADPRATQQATTAAQRPPPPDSQM